MLNSNSGPADEESNKESPCAGPGGGANPSPLDAYDSSCRPN